MARLAIEEIMKGYEKGKSERDLFLSIYEPAYKYGFPSRYGAISPGNRTPSAAAREDIFDTSYEDACKEGSKTIQSFLFPPNTDWIGFQAGKAFDRAPKFKKDAAHRQLEPVAEVMNLFKGQSNFDAAASPFCDDLMVGHGYMAHLEGTYEKPINYVTIPFNQIVRKVDGFGESCCYWREWEVENEFVKELWPAADYSYESGKGGQKHAFIYCCYRDDKSGRWREVVICRDGKDGRDARAILERSHLFSPIQDLPWEISPGENYGRGLALNAVVNARRLNKFSEYSLRSLAFDLPMFLVRDNSIDLRKFKPYPGAGIRVKSNESTNPSIAPLQLGNRGHDLEQFHMDRVDMSLRRSLGASSIPNMPVPGGMTATEVSERITELSRFQYTDYGRMMNYIQGGIQRDLEIYRKFGYVPEQIDPRSFNGFGYAIKVHTRLAQMQKSGEYENMLRITQMYLQLDPSGQYARRRFKFDELTGDLSGGLGMPQKYIRTMDELEEYDRSVAEAQAAASAASARQSVDVSNAIEQGKQEARSNANI
ncbi:MAG: head-tail connector protein [Rickettsiales bacterium]|nr:head-tail connector protein [Rickettsiales bacterium]